jgi:Tfp pilus assembly protein PilN
MTVDVTKGGADTDLAGALAVAYTVPRVNLLPPEITAARALRRTQGLLGGCVLLVVGAITGVFVLSVLKADTAAENLAAEQAVTTVLTAEQAEYARVPLVLAQLEGAETARATAMGSEVLWHSYLEQLALSYPPNVWLGDITATVALPGAGAAASADPLATPGIGTVAFTGTALSSPDVAAWLDVLEATPGFADASLTSATRTEREGQVVVDFTTGVAVTDEALSHRFDGEDG